jgi:hypothetical protein
MAKAEFTRNVGNIKKSLFMRRTSICNGTNTMLEDKTFTTAVELSKEMKE